MKKLLFSSLLVCIFLLIFSGSLTSQTPTRFSMCSKESGTRKKFGYRFGIRIPKGAKFKYGGDIDFSSIALSYGKGDKRVWMSGMSGPNATGGQPTSRVLKSSEKYEIVEWGLGELKGVDYKGISKDGTHWRYLGFFGEAIWYNDMSPEAAAFFDKVFDDVCFYEVR